MRDTKEMTQGAIDFKDKIDQLNADQREHLRKAIERLVACCVDQTRHAVIVFGKDDDPRAEVFTLNCNEMDAAVHVGAFDTAGDMVDSDCGGTDAMD